MYYLSVPSMTIATRRLAATATDAACCAIGRRAVIRASRYVLLRARLDYPNNMKVNGEASAPTLGAWSRPREARFTWPMWVRT